VLQNAVTYSPAGGDVVVSLRPYASPSDHSSDHRTAARAVEIEVRDGGIGIPTEHLDRVFERFHRVDTRLTREAEGLGLGLAIARRVVELHGGSIWAESDLGSGSTFHIVLPLHDQVSSAHEMERDADDADDGEPNENQRTFPAGAGAASCLR
jgi:signal transduction histidine kinase